MYLSTGLDQDGLPILQFSDVFVLTLLYLPMTGWFYHGLLEGRQTYVWLLYEWHT